MLTVSVNASLVFDAGADDAFMEADLLRYSHIATNVTGHAAIELQR